MYPMFMDSQIYLSIEIKIVKIFRIFVCLRNQIIVLKTDSVFNFYSSYLLFSMSNSNFDKVSL